MKYQCYLIRINFEKPYIKVGKTTNWANRKKNYLQNIPKNFLEELKFWDFDSKEEMDVAEKALIKIIDVDFKYEYSSNTIVLENLMNIDKNMLLADYSCASTNIEIPLPSNTAKTSSIRIVVKKYCKLSGIKPDEVVQNVVTVTINNTTYRTTIEDFYNLRDTLMPHVLPYSILDIDGNVCIVYDIPSLTFTTL